MSADRAAFIRAIRADPDNDVPRLVFADWLDENGDPARAEFIRVQCWLARHTEEHPDWRRNKEREIDLLVANDKDWSILIPEWSMYVGGNYDRGFASWFDMFYARDFVNNAVSFFNQTATDRLLIEKLYEPELDLLSNCPELLNIRYLAIEECKPHPFNPEICHRFLISPFSQNLTWLAMDYNMLGTEMCQLLATSAFLPNLQHFHPCWPDYYHDDPIDIIQLLESPHRTRLTSLALNCIDHREELLPVLCASPAISRLTHLTLIGGSLNQNEMDSLIHSPYLSRIKYLWIPDLGANLSPDLRGQLRTRFGSRLFVGQEQPDDERNWYAHRLALATGRIPSQ